MLSEKMQIGAKNCQNVANCGLKSKVFSLESIQKQFGSEQIWLKKYFGSENLLAKTF